MDKKPLIVVSLCAVVLLVLGSLSNVVGYQSVKSTVNDSPLFQTRTQRAMNQQQNSITSNYLGKGKTGNLLIFQRPDKISSLHNVINEIQEMDDASFQRFVSLAVHQLSKEEKLKDVTSQQIITVLNQLRHNPQEFMDYSRSTNENVTIHHTPTVCWFPGCLIVFILLLIYGYIERTRSVSLLSYCVCPK